MSDEAKAKILEFIKSKSKAKTKFYMNDLRKPVPDMSKKDVKKVVSEMIEDGTSRILYSRPAADMTSRMRNGRQPVVYAASRPPAPAARASRVSQI